MELSPLGSGWAKLIDRAVHGLEPALARAAQDARGEALLAEHWGAPVSAYLDELVVWNRRTDLTAARSPEELVDLTVADAAIVAAASEARGTWIDVGSGAGSPGLVLALMRPGLSILLVEPRDRRVAFLRSVIGRLGLDNVRVERKRSSAIASATCDTAISRATLPPAEWLEEGGRLARRAVWVLLARESLPTVSGFHADLNVQYEWPLTSAPRRAVRFLRDSAVDSHH